MAKNGSFDSKGCQPLSVNVRAFFGEATALDPRFKHKLENDYTVWDRMKDKVLAAAHPTETEQVFILNMN